MNDGNVRKALISAANSFLTGSASITTAQGVVTGLPTILSTAICWENKTFDPAGKALWAAVNYVPNIPEGRTIGLSGYDSINGFLQIDLNIAPDQGDGSLIPWEKKARIFFHGGRFFTYEGQSVLVISAGMSQGRIVENFYRKSVTVNFRSHLKRNEVV